MAQILFYFVNYKKTQKLFPIANMVTIVMTPEKVRNFDLWYYFIHRLR